MTFLPPADLRSQLAALHRESFVWARHCCGGSAGRAEDVLQDAYVKILDGRAQKRRLAELDARGIRRRSASERP